MKDYLWLRDELNLLMEILTIPPMMDENIDQRIGEYMGTHRAATHILQGIIDALVDVIEKEEAKEDF